MVHLTLINFIRKNGYDSSFKKHKIFRLSANFFGRKRNCYSLAIRAVQRALLYATKGRKLKSDYVHSLRVTRLDAACTEHDVSYRNFRDGLAKCEIALDAKVLTDLAIWEPRTFQSLTQIAKMKAKIEAPSEVEKFLTAPDGVITRGML